MVEQKIEKPRVCASCGKKLPQPTPEQLKEMDKEREELFGDVPVENCGVVCDDCFQEMDKTYHFKENTMLDKKEIDETIEEIDEKIEEIDEKIKNMVGE